VAVISTPCRGNGTGLYGEFTKVTTTGGSLGGVDLGVRSTRLVG